MLEVKDIDVCYGKIHAVQALSLVVAQGEIVALVGANGAGKSSILNAICGLVSIASGRIDYLGLKINGLGTHSINRRGIILVPEGRLIFKGLTVRENLMLGGHGIRKRGALEEDMKRMLTLFPALRNRLDAPGSSLSGGEEQLLALARGLVARPNLLLLDEPALGLSPRIVEDVFKLIRSLKEQGHTILMVEQNVRQALSIADRGYVVEGGRILLSGKADQLLNHKLLVHSYLGI